MTKRRPQLGFALALVLVVTVAVFAHFNSRSRTGDALASLGDVSHLAIQYQGESLRLHKVRERWQIVKSHQGPVADLRANHDLVTHLLDLIRTIKKTDNEHLDPKSAGEYGMNKPELALTLSWDFPRLGDEILMFGHGPLFDKNLYVYAPKALILMKTSSRPMILLEGKTILDFRDRRVTTFDTDDLEDIGAEGKCSPFAFSRDGDRWLSIGKPALALDVEKLEAWLTTLLSQNYDGIDESGTRKSDNHVCTIRLRGRGRREERLEIFKSDGTLWAKNSGLPAFYRMPVGILESLIPPKVEGRTRHAEVR